ncbi:MAG TPA: hypothetical protein VLA37_14425 [Sphingomonadaceae bacterium]|nr:hypothetical protein [Sphingomonadaceae bacterium]
MKGAAAAAVLMVGAGGALAHDVERIGGKPNLNGIWQVMNTANYDLEPHSASDNSKAAISRLQGALAATPAGLGVVVGGTIPYKEEAKALREQHRRDAPGWDPEAACYLPGIPRATYIDLPFQIIQDGQGDMLFVYEYASANRVINMQDIEIPPIDTWMGTSYGQWDGDTLVVTTLSQSPGDYKGPEGEMRATMTWLDRSGNYISNHATVTERFTANGPNHIDYEVTIDDPEVFTRPWTMKMPLYRRMEENAQLLEFKCVPFSELLLYGDLLETDSGQ